MTGVPSTPDVCSAPGPQVPSVTVIIPMFNEVSTIGEVLRRLRAVTIPCDYRIVVVDDASTDGSPAQVTPFLEDPSWAVDMVRLPANGGKGWAIASGARAASTTHIVVLDADLELAPEDLPAVVSPIVRGEADAVVGVREKVLDGRHLGSGGRTQLYRLANLVFTRTFNAVHGSSLRDVGCGYKVIPTSAYHALGPSQLGFAVDIELAAGMIREGLRVRQVPVSYMPRGIKDGKKIRARDAFTLLRTIVETRRRVDGR